jgi:pimeloyl-ACP methyl ester carboxylesterase
MVEDVYEFLTDMNLRQVSIMGHSMGGLTAMNFASEYPHRLHRLVIVDIAPRPYSVFHEDIIKGLLSIDLKTIKSRKEADIQLSHVIDNANIRQFLLKNLYRHDQRGWNWRLNLPVIAKNLPEIGKGLLKQNRFEKPVLFIRGALSLYITDADIPLIKNIYPMVRIETIPDATHWLHSEYPEQLIAYVNAFTADGEGL